MKRGDKVIIDHISLSKKGNPIKDPEQLINLAYQFISLCSSNSILISCNIS